MHYHDYCLVICRVTSTDQIYQRAAKRRGDKFDRSMTRGKLLDNDSQLFIFIFIFILIMTHFTQGTQKTDNRTNSRNGSSRKSQLQPFEWENGHFRRIIPVLVRWLNRGKESSYIRITSKIEVPRDVRDSKGP